MSKIQLILGWNDVAEKVIAWVRAAKPGSRVTLEEPRRSDAQNRLLWATLNDIAEQGELGGRKYDAETWKCVFMHALGEEMRFVPTLDGTGFVPIGYRSSKLTVRQMSDLQELMTAYAAEKGIKLMDDYRFEGLEAGG